MAKLTDDERNLLDELTARAAEPDADDYEVSVWNGDKGVTLPVSKAAAWLHEHFGIGDAPAAPSESGAGEPPAGKPGKVNPGPPQTSGGYFGGTGRKAG
jgi:hypothetical protein